MACDACNGAVHSEVATDAALAALGTSRTADRHAGLPLPRPWLKDLRFQSLRRGWSAGHRCAKSKGRVRTGR